MQEGFLTDSSFSNIVLGDASGLYTPDWPLLAGTRRAELLRTGRVTARPIRAEELEHYAAAGMKRMEEKHRLVVQGLKAQIDRLERQSERSREYIEQQETEANQKLDSLIQAYRGLLCKQMKNRYAIWISQPGSSWTQRRLGLIQAVMSCSKSPSWMRTPERQC